MAERLPGYQQVSDHKWSSPTNAYLQTPPITTRDPQQPLTNTCRDPGRPLGIALKFHGQTILIIWSCGAPSPGVETPVTPDEPGAGQPDVLDAGDAVEGAGVSSIS
jgi:hypothetical protein